MSYVSEMAVEGIENGSTTVVCDKFLNIIKNLPESNIVFEDDDDKIKISPEGTAIEFKLRTIEASAFPSLDFADEDGYFKVSQKDFTDMINQVIFAVSDDESKYAMNGALLEKDGSGAKLAITEDMEDMFYYKMIMEPDIIDSFTFDSSFRNDLIDWSNNTSSNVILIYGGTDVWYPLRLPDVENRDNIHTFVAPSTPHTANIYKLDIQDQKEAQALINEAMGN